MNPGALRGTHPPDTPRPFLPYRTGGTWMYGPPSGAGGSSTLVQDTMYAIPFYIPVPTLFVGMTVMTAAGTASASARLGIYADDGAVPGNLILEAGSVATTSGGNKTVVMSLWLPVGWVWLACAVQGAAGSLWTNSAGNYGRQVGTRDPFTGENNGYTRTGVSAALPASWGTTKTETPRLPMIWISPA